MKELLSRLPNMNSLLEHPFLSDIGSERLKKATQEYLDELRNSVLSGDTTVLPPLDDCAKSVLNLAMSEPKNLRKVINATGVILHTNLGRAPLGKDILSDVIDICSGYCNLEYNIKSGKRGSRYSHVENLICELSGAEAAMVVNNNAAAMVLILGTLAKGKKVAISRGELVEIGGSLRVPEIIVQSGAELVEIGSTNKTRLSDYEDAVKNKDAELLLKVHTSNYEIVGFTESVSVFELSELGKSLCTPVIYDVGACFLLDVEHLGFNAGETACSGLRSGADVVCFSGDKLMGSAQAGIIAGRLEYINAMKKHPLTRALRPDKLTLSMLESALRLHMYPSEATSRIPVLSMLFADTAQLRKQAMKLSERLQSVLDGWSIDVCEVSDETGGGSLPNVPLPGWAVSIKPPEFTLNKLEEKLRFNDPPVVIRIRGEAALISPRTLLPGDDDIIVDAFCKCAGK